MKRIFFIAKRIILICMICIVSGVLTGKHASAQGRKVLSASDGEPDFVFAFYNKVLVETEIKDTKSAIDYWIRKLANRVDMEIAGYNYESLDSLHNDFKRGLIDWVNIAPSDYLVIRDDIEADLGPIAIIGGKTTRKYLLIVRSDSSILDIEDLEGKKLTVTEDNEGGRIYLNTLLWRNGLNGIEDYFHELIEKRTFPQVILAVFFGQADACIALDNTFKILAELNPQISERLTVIASSPELVHAVSLFRKNLDGEIRKKFEKEIYYLEQSVEGKQVLTLFKIDRMVPMQGPELQSMEKLLGEYNKLKRERTRSKTVVERK